MESILKIKEAFSTLKVKNIDNIYVKNEKCRLSFFSFSLLFLFYFWFIFEFFYL